MQRSAYKLLCVLMVLLLVMTAAAGCGSGKDKETGDSADNSTEDVQDNSGDTSEDAIEETTEPEVTLDLGGRTIRYAAWWDLTPDVEASELAEKTVDRVSNMEEKYNFKLEYVDVPDEQYVEKFTASTLAGDPIADIAWMQNNNFFPGLVINGFCYPVGDLAGFDFNDERWNPFITKLGTYEGKIYGFDSGPTAIAGGVFWNKTLFEREGLPNLYELQNSKQWTWDKMKEIAIKATKDTDGDGKIDQWGMVGDFKLAWALIHSNNAQLMEMVDGKPVFTLGEPEAIKALQFVQDMVNVDKVMPIPPEGSVWDWPISEFQSGKYAMHGGEWWESWRYQENMEDDYGFVVYPMGPDSDEYTHLVLQANLKVMPATVKNPEDVAVIWSEFEAPFPDQDPEAWKDEILQSARDGEAVDTIGMIRDGNQVRSDADNPQLVGTGDIWQLGWQTIRFIGNGQKTAQVAIQEIAQAAQTMLEDAFAVQQ